MNTYPIEDSDFDATSQEISQLKTLPYKILNTMPFLLSMFEIIRKRNLYLNTIDKIIFQGIHILDFEI